MSNAPDLDVHLVPGSGSLVRSTKVAFFGLIPSLRTLLCKECSHEEVVIILPHAQEENLRVAINKLEEEQNIDKIIKILTGVDTISTESNDISLPGEKYDTEDKVSSELNDILTLNEKYKTERLI